MSTRHTPETPHPYADDLTPWFPADVRPVRKGSYEVLQLGRRSMATWNGIGWETDCWPMYGSWDDKWRGLASPPKDSA